MNNADIVGLVCIVIGLFLVIPAIYGSPVFLLIAGAVISCGIVLIITGGIMCRAKEDQEPDERPVYAEAVPKVVEVESGTTGQPFEPPLVNMGL
jgi:hypothetical protein